MREPKVHIPDFVSERKRALSKGLGVGELAPQHRLDSPEHERVGHEVRVTDALGQRRVRLALAIRAFCVARLKQICQTPDASGQLQGNVTGFPGELDNLGRKREPLLDVVRPPHRQVPGVQGINERGAVAETASRPHRSLAQLLPAGQRVERREVQSGGGTRRYSHPEQALLLAQSLQGLIQELHSESVEGPGLHVSPTPDLPDA